MAVLVAECCDVEGGAGDAATAAAATLLEAEGGMGGAATLLTFHLRDMRLQPEQTVREAGLKDGDVIQVLA